MDACACCSACGCRSDACPHTTNRRKCNAVLTSIFVGEWGLEGGLGFEILTGRDNLSPAAEARAADSIYRHFCGDMSPVDGIGAGDDTWCALACPDDLSIKTPRVVICDMAVLDVETCGELVGFLERTLPMGAEGVDLDTKLDLSRRKLACIVGERRCSALLASFARGTARWLGQKGQGRGEDEIKVEEVGLKKSTGHERGTDGGEGHMFRQSLGDDEVVITLRRVVGSHQGLAIGFHTDRAFKTMQVRHALPAGFAHARTQSRRVPT